VTSQERLILDFGDAHCLYSALRICGLNDVICATLPKQADTLMSLLGYRLLAGTSNRYAEDWWEGSYARILFPNAKLRSQRISEFYKLLGDEAVHRDFFSRYLGMFCRDKQAGVLIDSTGMPNDIHFPLTAINTHNGVTSNETRLLLVVDRKTKMPLFFRYNAGNIVDVTTLRTTIAELEVFGVCVDYAIVDAGYYSESNVRGLYGDDAGGNAIPFLTRIGSNLTLYKQLSSEHIDDLLSARYLLMQRDRLLSVKRVEIDLFGHLAYAYVAIDHARRQEEIYKYAKSALGCKDISHEEMNAAMKTKGIFILISSEKIETDEILPLYYTRQTVEQVFDVSKNNADLLPLRVHNEDTFRGHLLLSFIATVAFLSINQLLADTVYNAEGAFLILSNQKCKVFDDCILPKEPTKKMNEIYKKLGIKSPVSISVCGKK
jgi:transposase